MILCRDRYLYLWDNPKNKNDFCADLCCLNVSVLCCTDVEVKLRVSKLLSGALWRVWCNLFGVLRWLSPFVYSIVRIQIQVLPSRGNGTAVVVLSGVLCENGVCPCLGSVVI